MRKISCLVSAMALVSAALVTGIAPSADAASNCTSSGGLACYYDGANYTGTRHSFPDSAPSGPCSRANLFDYWASSLYNNSVNTQTWFNGTNFSGSSITVGRQSGRATLSSTFNNRIKSWKGTCYGGTRVSR